MVYLHLFVVNFTYGTDANDEILRVSQKQKHATFLSLQIV